MTIAKKTLKHKRFESSPNQKLKCTIKFQCFRGLFRHSMGPTYSVQGALHTGSRKVQAHDCIAGFRGMCRQAITVHLGQSQVLLCFPGHKSNMLTKTLFQKVTQHFGQRWIQQGGFHSGPNSYARLCGGGKERHIFWGCGTMFCKTEPALISDSPVLKYF